MALPGASLPSVCAESLGVSPEIFVGLGHSAAVQSVAISPDGRFAVSGGWDATVKVWDLVKGRLVRTLDDHTQPVEAVSFSPDGKWIASGGLDGVVRLWDATTGECSRTLKETAGYMCAPVSFSPDSRLLATGTGAKTGVKIWEVAGGRGPRVLAGGAKDLQSVCFSPKGQVLASGHFDSSVEVWDVEQGKQIRTIKAKSGVNAISFSPDGTLMATGDFDGALQIWDCATGRLVSTVSADTQYLSALSFSPDGQVIATGGRDGIGKLWDAATGKLIRKLEGHRGKVRSICFTPDGTRILTGSTDSSLKVWDVSTGLELRGLKGETAFVYAVAFSPDDQTLATGSKDGAVRLWQIATGRLVRTLVGHRRWAVGVCFSPDGKWLAAAGHDKTARIWEVTSGREVHVLKGHEGMLSSIAVSPDGSLLATGARKTIKVWDPRTGRERYSINAHGGSVHSLCFSTDGRLLASGSWDKTAKLWNAATGLPMATLEGHEGGVWAARFSPNARLLATAGKDTVVKLWDTRTYREVRALRGHEHTVTSLAFSPDGKTLASSGFHETIKLWNVSTGVPIQSLAATRLTAYSLEFNPNGRLLASGHRDGTARLWRPDTGALVASSVAIGDGFVTWTPEGYFAATPEAEDVVSIRARGAVESLGQYRDLFYRPDLVARKIAGQEVDLAALRRLRRFADAGRADKGKMPQVALPPKVRIVVPEGDTVVSQNTIQLTAEASDDRHKIISIVLSVNGKVQRGFGGMTEAPNTRAEKSWAVTLTHGENTLAVYALSSAGVRSAVVERKVTYREASAAEVLKPDLWMLAIAVSEYKNPAYSLRYPVEDARKLVERLQGQTGKLFRRVHVKLLLDNEATREDINDAADEFLSQASPRDLAVLFIAGHGVTYRGRFYFLTYDADADRPRRRAYSWHDVQEELLAPLAAQKIALFVDTCHAGGITGTGAQTRAVEAEQRGQLDLMADQLKEATGCYVVMASTSGEKALEARSWGGGAFTKAVVEGLSGRAVSHGVVMMWGLLDYVDRRVIELTGGAQHPVVKMPRNARNFPISVSGK